MDTDEELRQLMRRIDIVVKLDSNKKVRYPVQLEANDSEVTGLVLPSNFRVSRDGERLIKELCENDTEDSLDVVEGISPGQDCVGQIRRQLEEEDSLREHPTSTPVPLADPG